MTSLQEIKAMLARDALDFRIHDTKQLLAFARAALPIVESAIDQEKCWEPGDDWMNSSESYEDACHTTERAATDFTESYPDERA